MITVIFKIAPNVRNELDQHRGDKALERARQEDPGLGKMPGAVAARLADKRTQKDTLIKSFQMSDLWAPKKNNGNTTSYVMTVLCDPSDVRSCIDDLEVGWPNRSVTAILAFGPDGRLWEERDEQGNVVDSVPVGPDLWEFLGPVQDGVDGNGDPVYRDRVEGDPWIIPNIVAGYTLPDLEALR